MATGQSEQTLIRWHKNKPKLFAVVILGAVVLRNPGIGERGKAVKRRDREGDWRVSRAEFLGTVKRANRLK